MLCEGCPAITHNIMILWHKYFVGIQSEVVIHGTVFPLLVPGLPAGHQCTTYLIKGDTSKVGNQMLCTGCPAVTHNIMIL